MKKLFALALLLLGAASLHAQEVYNSSGRRAAARPKQQNTGFDPNRIIFGGGIAFGFNSNSLVLGASPILGYRLTGRLAAGIGVGYLYYRIKEEVALYDPTIGGMRTFPYKSSLLYPSIWSRFLITQNIFAHAEFEYDFQTYKYYDIDSDPASPTVNRPVQFTDKVQTQALLLGGGLRQPISTNTSILAMVLYDVLQQPRSPYKNRIDFRVGVSVGF